MEKVRRTAHCIFQRSFSHGPALKTKTKGEIDVAVIINSSTQAIPDCLVLQGAPCGVEYFVRCYVLETDREKSHRRSAVSMAIRKIQLSYSLEKRGGKISLCTTIREKGQESIIF